MVSDQLVVHRSWRETPKVNEMKPQEMKECAKEVQLDLSFLCRLIQAEVGQDGGTQSWGRDESFGGVGDSWHQMEWLPPNHT